MGFDVAEQIAASVLERAPVNGIRIVGVDGRSGAGKSFLASRLSTLLVAPVIEIDDFVSWDCFAGWWPRFDEQVLSPLLSGSDATYQARDWTDWYGSTPRQLEDATMVPDDHPGGCHLYPSRHRRPPYVRDLGGCSGRDETGPGDGSGHPISWQGRPVEAMDARRGRVLSR